MGMAKRMWKLSPTLVLLFTCGWLQAAPNTAANAPIQYLSDHSELLLNSQQGWGELGWDVAAHQSGQPGTPLQIGTQSYTKGLGHHANGSITVALDGQFEAFDAEVGLQPCGTSGSVIFRVFVDGAQQFASGVMRTTNRPLPIRVRVAGAQELRLEANDAGDDITCDMANWAGARLTPAAGQPVRAMSTVDMAPFARVVTWDPHRQDGARANRVEQFRAEDLFLETEAVREADGCYRVPASADGLGCIGLQWLNRRALKSVALEFAPGATVPAANAVQVQGWFGESAWQGGWKPLPGEMQAEGNRLSLNLSPKAGAQQTQKVRWIFPHAAQARVRSLSAFTRSRWESVRLRVETERKAGSGRGEVSVFNGELLKTQPAGVWNLKQPLALEIRYSRPSSFKSDPTVLQFRLPLRGSGDSSRSAGFQPAVSPTSSRLSSRELPTFDTNERPADWKSAIRQVGNLRYDSGNIVSVAVEDVLSNDCVYLPDLGLFVTRDPAPVTLQDYKARIAGRKTILQQVRTMPDQTLAQAMARTHHEAQREGPVMLSLACDNLKFVLERDGLLRVPGTTNPSGDWFAAAGEIRPQFGTGSGGQLTRALDGGWLPVPVITVSKEGLIWRERVFVAPTDEPGSNPARLNRPSVCVAEFTVSNAQSVAASAALTLDFLTNSNRKQPAALAAEPGTVFQLGPELKGILQVSEHCPLRLQVNDNKASLLGTLPAGGTACLTVCLADSRVELPTLASKTERLHDATAAYWNAALAPAMQVETPEPLLNDLIRSSQVRCLIAARNEAEGARIAPWIAAMSYGPLESEANSIIRGMAFMGHEDFARRSLDFFIHRYNTNGLLTTGYTTFGTPWHLWTLSEYHQLYRNNEWLREAAPELRRVGEWLIRQTEKTRHNGADGAPVPESGLMPPGVLADWNAFAFHYTMNAYCFAGLHGLGKTLATLPQSGESLRFEGKAAELRTNILRAYRWTQAQSPALRLRDGTWIPAYPSQVHSPGKLADFFPGQDGGRSWCYDVELGAHQLVPTGVWGPRRREAERIVEHMEDVQFLADGWFDYPAAANEQDWFNLGGFSKVQPYYTRNAELYALRDDVKPFIRSYFNTLAAMLNPEVMTFWEHFHHSGAWDKTHETGYFLHQTRSMLVMERDDQLWLAPLISTNWLADGKRLSVSNAPTRFGAVSYCVESHAAQGRVTVTIHSPERHAPDKIILRLRHPEDWSMRAVKVNGQQSGRFDKSLALVSLKPAHEVLEVQVFYEPPRSQKP
jgi:hypothetical protein